MYPHTRVPTHTQRAVPVPGDARDDWKIIRALSEVLGTQLPYDTLQDVQDRLQQVSPNFAHRNTVEPALWLNGQYFKVGGMPVEWGVGCTRVRVWYTHGVVYSPFVCIYCMHTLCCCVQYCVHVSTPPLDTHPVPPLFCRRLRRARAVASLSPLCYAVP